MLYKYCFESPDEVQLPFVPQGVAANKCDATMLLLKQMPVIKKKYF